MSYTGPNYDLWGNPSKNDSGLPYSTQYTTNANPTGTSVSNTPGPATGTGANSGSGSGSNPIGNGYNDTDIRYTQDGHIYAYDRQKGTWTDAGTDATAAAAQLGIPVAVLQQVVADQQRTNNGNLNSKLIGANSDGTVSWVGPDGKIATGSIAQAKAAGITEGELTQASQEEAYRTMRANDATFQMGSQASLGGQSYQQYNQGTQLAQAPLDREAAMYQRSNFGSFDPRNAAAIPAGQVYSPGQSPYPVAPEVDPTTTGPPSVPTPGPTTDFSPGAPEGDPTTTGPPPTLTPGPTSDWGTTPAAASAALPTAPPAAAATAAPARTGASTMSVPPGVPAPAPAALPNPGVPTGAPSNRSSATGQASTPVGGDTVTPSSYSGGIQNMQSQYNRSLPNVTTGYNGDNLDGMTHQQAGQYSDDLATRWNVGNNQFRLANQATDQANQGQQMAVQQNKNQQLGQSRSLSGMGYPTQPAQVTGLS